MLALRLDIRLLIAPPLIVAFYELSGNHQKLRSQAPRLYFLTISMAFISAYLRYFLIFSSPITFLFLSNLARMGLMLNFLLISLKSAFLVCRYHLSFIVSP